mgnify:CR=1 FL=1
MLFRSCVWMISPLSVPEGSVFVNRSCDSMQCGQTSKADGLAMSSSTEHLRIAVGEEAAHVVADHIEAGDGVAFGRDGLEVGVDADAVHSRQEPAADRDAEERAFLDRGHILLHLAYMLQFVYLF